MAKIMNDVRLNILRFVGRIFYNSTISITSQSDVKLCNANRRDSGRETVQNSGKKKHILKEVIERKPKQFGCD